MSASNRLKSVLKELLPPILLKVLRRRPPPEPTPPYDPQIKRMDAFYASLLPKNGLCFDIGANVGNRLAAFRRLGFSVVAVEPQTDCHSLLQATYGKDPLVKLVKKALGRTSGRATMQISDASVLSSLSPEFIEATTKSGRFDGISWNRTEEVEMTTLDALIAEHGEPAFVKIDVEGFEFEVVSGLSRPLRLISLEWTPELTDKMLACIDHVAGLGPVGFNLSWGESMRLSRARWMSADETKALLNQFREETSLFADVYIRSESR